MKKTILILLLICGMSSGTFAFTNDSTDTATSTPEKKSVSYGLTVATGNVWRGLQLGYNLSFQGNVNIPIYRSLHIGADGAVGMGGNSYGNSIKTYVGISHKHFSLMVNDYYYFPESSDYFNYGDNTLHNVEGSLKYDDSKAYCSVGYTLYSMKSDDTNGAYIEAGYKLGKGVSAVVGYVTDKSSTNFSSKEGFSNIGMSFEKEIKITDSFKTTAKTAIVVNPNYKNMADLSHGSTNNQMHFNLSLTF